MYSCILTLLSLLLVGGLTTPASAALSVAELFSDHAVLQRHMAVPVRGTANAGEQVTVTYNAQVVSTFAASDGTWRVDLLPMDASGPSPMIISAASGTIRHDCDRQRLGRGQLYLGRNRAGAREGRRERQHGVR